MSSKLGWRGGHKKLFAAVNTGSFHKSMTGTRVSFTLTNKLLTAIKNDPIISGKKAL